MTSGSGRLGSLLEWSSAGAPLEGQAESGDLHLVAPFDGGALVAAIDGLGHGPKAAAAARQAARILADHAGAPVLSVVKHCHDGLRGTRGVVMSLASFAVRDATMTWLGVGNVEAVLLRASRVANPPREAISLRGGVVGGVMPTPRAGVLHVAAGDTLVMTTDGVRDGFASAIDPGAGVMDIAQSVFAGWRKGTDDALVLVARYGGGGP